MIIHDGMTMRISPSLLVGAACALLSITADAQQSYITFKGTTSPDKRWCLGWGVANEYGGERLFGNATFGYYAVFVAFLYKLV